MSLFFPRYYGMPSHSRQGVAGAGVSVMLHVVVLLAIAYGYTHQEQLQELAKPLTVSLVEAPRPEQPQVQPVPPKPRQVQPTRPQPVPVAAAVSTTPSPSAPTGVLQPVTAPVSVQAAPAVAVPVEVPVSEARFDADYLSNPKPYYPPASRRMGEMGTVYLRVQVSVDGSALQVELKKSSGFPRLDQSALDTVARWKFVPAKKGNAPVTSWVVVPIVFSLS